MINYSLIEKIKALEVTHHYPSVEDRGWNSCLVKVVDVIRQHQAEKTKDMVERVATAIENNVCSIHGDPVCGIENAAKAAIAALGDGSAAIAPVSAETVQPITPASDGSSEISDVILAINKGYLTAIVQESEALPGNYYMPFRNGKVYHINRLVELMEPYLRQPSPPVDIEAGAIACSQWVYGANHGAPSWDRLSEEHRNEYREQAKACARAWGMKYAG